MNYATGYAMNTNDLFLSFPTSKMKLTTQKCEELIGNRHKETIAKSVFKSAVGLVIEDIINNGNIFELPTRSKQAQLKMKRVDGDDFIRFRKAGKWRDVDFIASDFAGYHMVMEFQTGGVLREKEVYLDKQHRDIITENTNNGKVYY